MTTRASFRGKISDRVVESENNKTRRETRDYSRGGGSASFERACSCIHLFLREDALDVNPTVRLDGAVAAVHRAYPRLVGLRDAR